MLWTTPTIFKIYKLMQLHWQWLYTISSQNK